MLEALPRAVASAEARPTEKIGRTNRKEMSRGCRETLVLSPRRAYCAAKNATEAALEAAVAIAAPATSRWKPKISRGSSATFSRPPNIMPALACRAWPSLRSRWPSARLTIVGTPPSTTTQSR